MRRFLAVAILLVAGCATQQTQVLVGVASKGVASAEQTIAVYHAATMRQYAVQRQAAVTTAKLVAGSLAVNTQPSADAACAAFVPAAQVAEGFDRLATKLNEIQERRDRAVNLKQLSDTNLSVTRQALYYISDLAMRQQATMDQLQEALSKVLADSITKGGAQ